MLGSAIASYPARERGRDLASSTCPTKESCGKGKSRCQNLANRAKNHKPLPYPRRPMAPCIRGAQELQRKSSPSRAAPRRTPGSTGRPRTAQRQRLSAPTNRQRGSGHMTAVRRTSLSASNPGHPIERPVIEAGQFRAHRDPDCAIRGPGSQPGRSLMLKAKAPAGHPSGLARPFRAKTGLYCHMVFTSPRAAFYPIGRAASANKG